MGAAAEGTALGRQLVLVGQLRAGGCQLSPLALPAMHLICLNGDAGSCSRCADPCHPFSGGSEVAAAARMSGHMAANTSNPSRTAVPLSSWPADPAVRRPFPPPQATKHVAMPEKIGQRSGEIWTCRKWKAAHAPPCRRMCGISGRCQQERPAEGLPAAVADFMRLV